MIKQNYFILIVLSIVSIISCQQDNVIPLPKEIVPFTENAFEYELMPHVIMPDTNEVKDLVSVEANKLIFNSSSVVASNVGVGDILFIPQAVDSFHLTKMAFKIEDKQEVSGQIELGFSEPQLKDIYDHFYLEVNNQTDIQFRDTTVDWTSLTELQIDEIKLVNATLIELSIPIGSNTTFTFKIGNVTAKLDFQYRYSTEYFNSINSLVDFEFGLKDIKIRDFTFQTEAEVKLTNGAAAEVPSVAISGVSGGTKNIVRVPTPFLAAVGIPLSANVDISPGFEVALAGKLVGSINFGTFSFLGDPLVIEYGVLGLETSAWAALASTISPAAAFAVFGGPGEVEIISYPNTYSNTGNNCLDVVAEFTGSVKGTVGVGVSFSLLGAPSAAVGVYMDGFIEAVGKIATTTCLGPGATPPTTTLNACVEVNTGIKLPYLVASSKAAGINPIEYNIIQFGILGEVKTNLMQWPEGCDPWSLVALANAEVTSSAACSGERTFLNFSVSPPASIMSPTTFSVTINGETISGLSYNILTSFYTDEHNLAGLTPGTFVSYEIRAESVDQVISVGQIYVDDCIREGCLIIEDPHLPAGGSGEYCQIVPELPEYSRSWIIDNMYYTPSLIGFDELTSGRCYNEESQNCNDFGRLYSFYAANGGRRNTTLVPWPGNDICPLGYHIPSKTEWEELIAAAGGPNSNAILSDEAWPNLFDINRNTSGFSAFPFGIFVPGDNGGGSGYQGLGEIAAYWSSTEAGASNGDSFGYGVFFTIDGGVEIKPTVKKMGLSCRCIQDE